MEIKIENNQEMLIAIENGCTNKLHIEGESRRVYAYTSYGNGISGDVWHELTIEFNLPDVVTSELLIDFIEDHEEKINGWLDGFSSHWDGSNLRGTWGHSEHAEHAFNNALQQSAENGSLGPDYWFDDPIDYITQAWGDVDDFRNEYPEPPKSMEDAREMAKDIIDGNDDNNCYLHFTTEALVEILSDEYCRNYVIWAE